MGWGGTKGGEGTVMYRKLKRIFMCSKFSCDIFPVCLLYKEKYYTEHLIKCVHLYIYIMNTCLFTVRFLFALTVPSRILMDSS